MRERIGKVFILQNYDYSVVGTRVLMTLTTFWVISRSITCFNFQHKHYLLVDPKQTVEEPRVSSTSTLFFAVQVAGETTPQSRRRRRGWILPCAGRRRIGPWPVGTVWRSYLE